MRGEPLYNNLPFLSNEKTIQLLCFRFWLFFYEIRHLIARLQVVYNKYTRMCTARTRAKFGDHTRGERLIFATPLALPILRIPRMHACNWPINTFRLPRAETIHNFLPRIVKNVDESCYISFVCLQSINETKQQ